MELRTAGEALLRSWPALLFPHFISYRATTSGLSQSRHFTASTRKHQQSSGETGRGAPSPQRAKSASSQMEDISRLLDSTLDLTQRAPASSSRSRSSMDARLLDRHRPPPGSSVDDVLSSVSQRKAMIQQQKPYDLLDANSWIPGDVPRPVQLTPLTKLPFTLSPSVGRSVQVDDRIDLGRAFTQLGRICSRNRVRADAMRQRFHERPGLKRKRLKSTRWRRRFKEGFKGIIQRVRKMKKQGW